MPSRLPESRSGDGRPIGGMVVFYKKSLSLIVQPLFKGPNFSIFDFKHNNISCFTLANMYLPHDSKDNEGLIEYQTTLGEFQANIDQLSCNNLIMVGDFNADPNKRFWKILKEFITQNSLTCADLCLPYDTFTYVSPAHNTCSWLDHIVVSEMMKPYNIKVLYEKSIYDHFPVYFEVDIPVPKIENSLPENIKSNIILWESFDSNCKRVYNDIVNSIMSSLPMDKDYVMTHDQIDHFYETLIFAMKEGTKPFSKIQKKSNFRPVPGWNDVCKERYNLARLEFLKWVQSGKIRSGPLYESMKKTRQNFRNSLKFCKHNAEQIKCTNLFEKFKQKNKKLFWRDVNEMRGNSCPQSLSVDGASKPIEIAKIFKNKFSSVTGGHISGSISKPYVNHTKSQEFFTEKELNIAVQKLNAGSGNDGIHCNHIKFLDSRCIKYILMFFNACTVSSYIPEKMLRGEITPRPKDKFGNIQSSENYREVMNSTNFFKILEYCMLDRMSYCVELSSQQFGYRENTSTSLAICLLKEVMQKYCSEKSKVFA